ncbi:MAG TPA: gliding motility-associated C-terminal domain-containing protein [Chitinophagales bacterium]|nr:gliding motility-associated C-terminal domain-containing protein [Chitinophagales bacterium]
MKQYCVNKILLFFSCCLLAFTHAGAQTVNAPDLNCVTKVSITGNIFVRLIWTIPVNSCGPFNAYYIYRSTSFNGPYTLVYTENNQAASSYDDNVGNGSIVYYYYMVSDFNCPGATVLHSDTLDSSDPEPPVINYVTVKNNAAEINWQPGNSPETFGYILYKVVGGINIPIDTIYGKNNTTYTDLSAAVNVDSVSYTLASIDSCLNTGPINVLPQHTIFLKQQINRCNNTITLDWYQYNHWDPIVLQYDVYVAVNGGPPSLIQTFPSNVLSYQVTGLNDGDFICFTVVATQTNTLITSTSNELCAALNVVQSANDLYIRNVTVAAPGRVDVYYSMDPLADLLSVEIQRSLDSIAFTELDVIAAPANLSLINIYADTTALTSQLSYYYRIIATDSCNNADTSSIGKSILLSGYAFSDLSFLLKWDASYIEYGTVAGYDVNRDDGSGFNSIAVFDKTVFEYAETGVPSVTPCYYVEAIDSMILPNGIIDTVHSRSNILCLNQPSQIYMPNAFAPQGKNNIFKPVLNVEGVTAFNFSVYNRWGKEIFTSLDQDLGWDGRDNGNLVQQGAYAYQVVVIDGNRKRIEAKGTVLVVR